MKIITNSQSQDEASIQGVPKRINLYAKVSKYAPRAIKRAAELMESQNESVALGAVKVILDKCLPDIKALTLDTNTTGKIEIVITEDKSTGN